MTDQRRQQAWRIYRTASELPEHQRRSYVASATDDPHLFEEVILLIAEQSGLPSPVSELKSGTIIDSITTALLDL